MPHHVLQDRMRSTASVFAHSRLGSSSARLVRAMSSAVDPALSPRGARAVVLVSSAPRLRTRLTTLAWEGID